MGFLSKLFGSKTPAHDSSASRIGVPSPGNPTEAHPIPEKLMVRAHAHSFPNTEGRFVTLVTRGLNSVNQREILFTLKTSDGDPLERHLEDLTMFLSQVYRWASEGKLVDALGFTQFGPRGVLGQSHNGILYMDAEPIPEVTLPSRALAAIVVDPQEIALIAGGLTFRVLTRRGEAYRHYPFPPWTDLRAQPSGADEQSIVSKVARGRTEGVSVLTEAGQVRMSIEPQVRTLMKQAFGAQPPPPSFAFLTSPSTKANARLVWRPGQTGPAAITPPGSDGSKMTGVFLLISGGGVERDEVRLVEDGYALLLTAATHDSLWRAIKQEQSFSLTGTEGMTFAVEWLPEN